MNRKERTELKATQGVRTINAVIRRLRTRSSLTVLFVILVFFAVHQLLFLG